VGKTTSVHRWYRASAMYLQAASLFQATCAPEVDITVPECKAGEQTRVTLSCPKASNKGLSVQYGQFAGVGSPARISSALPSALSLSWVSAHCDAGNPAAFAHL
jgi:hypothetical protein